MNKTINIEVKKVDYRSIFFLGFIFNFAGIATVISTRNPAPIVLMAFGIILMINGLMNKDKWYDKNV